MMKAFAARLMRVLKSKKGFTLIEVVLSMTVSTILLIAVAQMMPGVSLSYVNNIELSYNRIIASNVADAIKNQLSCAIVLSLDSNKVEYANEYGTSTIDFSSANPVIPGLTYDPAYYIAKDVMVSVARASPTSPNFTVTVTVGNRNGTGGGDSTADYTLERSFRQLNSH